MLLWGLGWGKNKHGFFKSSSLGIFVTTPCTRMCNKSVNGTFSFFGGQLVQQATFLSNEVTKVCSPLSPKKSQPKQCRRLFLVQAYNTRPWRRWAALAVIFFWKVSMWAHAPNQHPAWLELWHLKCMSILMFILEHIFVEKCPTFYSCTEYFPTNARCWQQHVSLWKRARNKMWFCSAQSMQTRD